MWKRIKEKLKSFWVKSQDIIILFCVVVICAFLFFSCHSVVDIHDLDNGSCVSGVQTEVDVL